MVDDRYITKTVNAVIRIRELIDNRYNELAEECRKEVVIPFCKKYDLSYVTGHGRNWFITSSNLTIDSVDAEIISHFDRDELAHLEDADELTPNEALVVSRPPEFTRELMQVFKLIQVDIEANASLGDYIMDYRLWEEQEATND